MRGSIAHAGVKRETQVSLADPSLCSRSPGEEFAWTLRDTGPDRDCVVPIRAHLPAAFPLFAERPRYAVRHLLKTASVLDGSVPYVHEPPSTRLDVSGTSYQSTPEGSFAPRLEEAELTDISVHVPVPEGLLDRPAFLASFVDYRVLVRLSVVENETLLHGSGDKRIPGLLTLSETRKEDAGADLTESLLPAAAQVEEFGGSCDGVVVHPLVYWEMLRNGVLDMLTTAGVTVSRTRMIPREQALLGDFKAAATLLLPDVASIALHRGAGPGGCDMVEAKSRLGLAVHLPQHFLLMTHG